MKIYANLIKTENYENSKLKFGVYGIFNEKTNKVYIGSTKTTFQKRLQGHMRELTRNNHPNQHLQNSWNKDGSEQFIFKILHICSDRSECEFFEAEYMKKFQSNLREFGFNKAQVAHYKFEYHFSPEIIERRIQKKLKELKILVDWFLMNVV